MKKRNRKLVFLFFDGVGIGKKNDDNPFYGQSLSALQWLCGGSFPFLPFQPYESARSSVVAVNATLGVAGLPQSGTGQTSIYTGVNAAKIFGRHFGPYPPMALQPILQERHLLVQMRRAGASVTFANAFPDKFFEYIESGTRKLSATSLACRLAGIPLLGIEALQQNRGISADFTRERWNELGHADVTPITPAAAGEHLYEISMQHDCTLFEYWFTDYAGHARNREQAVLTLMQFDEFLDAFLTKTDLRHTLLFLISDHGNVEDLSTRSHTRHRVPCIAAGEGHRRVTSGIHKLYHTTPALLQWFK